jgi:hypothetical protein
VRGAEDGVQVFRIGRTDVNGQQQPFFFGQQFLGFVKEDLEELGDIDGHGRTPSISRYVACPAWMVRRRAAVIGRVISRSPS